MGISRSKLKKQRKQLILVNTNIPDVNLDLKYDKSDDIKPPDIEDAVNNAPSVKWKKANPRESILKIQREAEIRDIETIYANSSIKEHDLLNLMPDHYWCGIQNKLPRYVLYRGDYPDPSSEKTTNLRRIKSSSLNDLSESNVFNFNADEDFITENLSSRLLFRSISCPHIHSNPIFSLSKVEKDGPRKGILKNRKANRPNSAMLVDIRNGNLITENNNVKLIPVIESDITNQIMEEMAGNSNKHQKSKISKNLHNGIKERSLRLDTSPNDDGILSGYFDQSPTRLQDVSLLRVNPDKKSWIKTNLDKRLNLRPTSMDLANRNILHDQDEYDRQNEFEQTRCLLNEKLSERPTLTELKKQKIIKFSDFVEIQETDNYDRSVARTWGRLTEVDKESIRNELNEFKDKEMKIHLRSKRFTKFHDSHNE